VVQVVGLSSPFPSAAAAQQAAQQAVQQNSPEAAFTFTLKSPQSIYVGMLDSDCNDNSGAVNFQIEKLDGGGKARPEGFPTRRWWRQARSR
jgi:hypothetical protein